MADIRDCVRSLLPGRARLRHPMLHGLEAESCREVAGMLETIPGVTGVSINPRVGSLLITWNEAETTAETLLETVEGYAAIFFAAGAEDEAGARRARGRKGRRPARHVVPSKGRRKPGACSAGSSPQRRRHLRRGRPHAHARNVEAQSEARRPHPAEPHDARRPCALDRRARRQADGRILGGRRLHGFLPCTCGARHRRVL